MYMFDSLLRVYGVNACTFLLSFYYLVNEHVKQDDLTSLPSLSAGQSCLKGKVGVDHRSDG